MKLTANQVKLAQSCKTPEELMVKAQDAGVVLSLEQAQAALDSVEMVELDADDMDVVSGGKFELCWEDQSCADLLGCAIVDSAKRVEGKLCGPDLFGVADFTVRDSQESADRCAVDPC